MRKEKSQSNTRKEILQAANELVLREGLNHLTLEAVARKAGVSKGGLLYHFASKEDLIKGMVFHLNDQFNAEVEQKLAQEKTEIPGSWLRAYTRASTEASSEYSESSIAIIAALVTNPQLLEPFRQSYAQYQQQAEQAGIDPVLATIIRLAVDGLWLAELFKLAPPTGALREQVLIKLKEMSHTS